MTQFAKNLKGGTSCDVGERGKPRLSQVSFRCMNFCENDLLKFFQSKKKRNEEKTFCDDEKKNSRPCEVRSIRKNPCLENKTRREKIPKQPESEAGEGDHHQRPSCVLIEAWRRFSPFARVFTRLFAATGWRSLGKWIRFSRSIFVSVYKAPHSASSVNGHEASGKHVRAFALGAIVNCVCVDRLFTIAFPKNRNRRTS
jgi:hypothetical protein